jgi:hypothetical protein
LLKGYVLGQRSEKSFAAEALLDNSELIQRRDTGGCLLIKLLEPQLTLLRLIVDLLDLVCYLICTAETKVRVFSDAIVHVIYTSKVPGRLFRHRSVGVKVAIRVGCLLVNIACVLLIILA